MNSTPKLKRISDLPSPDQHWLKGILGQFKPGKLHTYFYQQGEKLGGMYQGRIFNRRFVVVCKPSTVQKILKRRPAQFRRTERLEGVFLDLGIKGVFSAEGAEWKSYRQLISQAFKPSNIKRMLPIIKKSSNRMLNILNDQSQDIDIQKIFQRLLVDITSELAFGYDLNTLDNKNNDIQEHLSFIFSCIGVRTQAPLPYWRYFKLERDKKLDQSLAVIRKQVNIFIQNARDRLAENDAVPENILEALLLAKDDNGQPYSEEVIYGNVITILLAGEDTTANTLSWVVHYLTKDMSLQEKLYQEVVNNYPSTGSLSWDDLDRFPLVAAACQESMRLQPTASFMFLQALTDEVVEGVAIPKGTTVVVLLAFGANNTELFPNPKKFDPMRWLSMEPELLKERSLELAPFGGGARLCPGMQLSLTEQKIALIELIKAYRFTQTDADRDVGSRYQFTVVPENLRVNVAARTETVSCSKVESVVPA